MGAERLVIEQRLVIEHSGDRTHVRLDRAETRNAIDQQMVDELHAVCAGLEREPKILILSGANGLFASGADIGQLRERRRDEALAVRLVTEVHEPDALLGAAHALPDRIAGNDPLAVQFTKRAMHAPADAHPEFDNLAQSVLFESPEKTRRMTEFLKRKKRP